MSHDIENQTPPSQFEEIDPDELDFEEADQADQEEDQLSADFVEEVIDRMMEFGALLVSHDLHEYQKPFARRVMQSVIVGDGATLSAMASRQSGKALAVDTPMLTANRGWTTMGDLVTGDYVYAPDGTPTQLWAHPIFHTDAYRVTLTDGRSVVASGKHLWGVYDRGGKYRVLNTYQLLEEGVSTPRKTSVGGREYNSTEYRWRMPRQEVVLSPDVALPVDPYLLGYWLGDGHSYSTNITCHRDDVANLLAQIPQYVTRVTYPKETAPDIAQVHVTRAGGGLHAELKRLGVLKYRKDAPEHKHIPEQYLAAGTEQRIRLLQGLMDSDGTATSASSTGVSRTEFCSTKKALAEDVLTLALSLGLRATLIEGTATLNGREIGPKYRVCWTMFEDDVQVFTLPRKLAKVRTSSRPKPRASIKSIERVEDQATRCITVDSEDKLFLAGRELIPTHNTEIISFVVSTLMILLPRLAQIYPDLLGKFKDGIWIGMFAPVESQAETLFGRTVDRLTSERALEILADPEINDITKKTGGATKGLRLQKCGSTLTMMTANPKANIESKSFHLIIIDEAQATDDFVVSKSIAPMAAYYNGTKVLTGTPTITKNHYYRTIQQNKRDETRAGGKKSHFQWDWKTVAKFNPNYEKFVKSEMLRIGEDSDEFRLSYRCEWILEQGMFISESQIEELGDKSQQVVKSWYRTPVVVGIDPARKQDSTVVTVVWVDWERPDEFGYYDHRVLAWLDLSGMDWEEQYFQIANFLANYNVLSVAVDANGVGDAVAQRLRLLLPRAEVVPVTSSPSEQSARYKHLQALVQRKMVGWPAHAYARRLRTYKRFVQQMGEAELVWRGPNMLVAAPDEAHAHDDYVDSLSLACSLTRDQVMPHVEVASNPLIGSFR